MNRVLHVGCGENRLEHLPALFQDGSWVETRVDINPDVKPDICCNMLDMRQIPGDSHDALFSSHNLEHLYSHEVPRALAEFRRVLKPGALLILNLPNLQKVAAAVAEDGDLEKTLYMSPAGPITPLDIFFGHRASLAQGNDYMAHKTGFSSHSIKNLLENAGFSKVSTALQGWHLWATAYK